MGLIRPDIEWFLFFIWYPRITDPFMELDRTGSGLSLKVRGDVSKAKRGHFLDADNGMF